MNEELWYKDGYFWRKVGPAWEKQVYGFVVDGTGDLIFNTCTRIIEQDDKSEWAYRSLLACSDLLLMGYRWPSRMNNIHMAKGRLRWEWSRLLYKLKIRKTRMYGPRGRMSRDPYIAMYACAVHLDRKQVIGAIRIPFCLYRPEIWWWRKRLIKPHKKAYVRRLRYLRALAIVKNHKT